MRMYDLIARKRDGGVLASDELGWLVKEYSAGRVPDYQMSAWLMAVYLKGMTATETAELTRAMTASGIQVSWNGASGVTVDKHSTGGVGDGVSLVLAPLAAACGLLVPMMSGRGLGHTGGTLDKLESIPGFRVNLTVEELHRQVKAIGVAMIGQTERVAPADRLMYALRDVTATVESIPLIAASIMSKKLAEGVQALLLDIKVGNGAFMKALAPARALAKAMVQIGRHAGRRMAAVITDMSQPLGFAVGNSLEMKQTVQVLSRGRYRLTETVPEDFETLVIEETAWMLVMAGVASSPAAGRTTARAALESGAALEKFRRMVQSQGGDPRVADLPDDVLPGAARVVPVLAPRAGYLKSVETETIGTAALLLGAGRLRKEDAIDPAVGLIVRKKLGERVEKGEPLVDLHVNREDRLPEVIDLVLKAYEVGPTRPRVPPLIHETIKPA